MNDLPKRSVNWVQLLIAKYTKRVIISALSSKIPPRWVKNDEGEPMSSWFSEIGYFQYLSATDKGKVFASPFLKGSIRPRFKTYWLYITLTI